MARWIGTARSSWPAHRSSSERPRLQSPVSASVVQDVDTWMDVHNHGGRWTPDVERLAEPGRFALKRLDFKMAGPWRVRFGVKASAAATAVRTSLPICVE